MSVHSYSIARTQQVGSASSVQARTTDAIALLVLGVGLLGTGNVYDLQKSAAWGDYVRLRVPLTLSSSFEASITKNQFIDRPDVRGISEHVKNIRQVFNIPLSDLAASFGVSRQAIYKWLGGDAMPDAEKQDRIIALSRVADKFLAAEVPHAESLLKMKTFGGKSLMDILMAGKDTGEYVTALIKEAKIMEASYERSGLPLSKAESTNDWQSSISIPGFPEKD